MSKLYLFAIGGSGSRVLRSLTMLLACGIRTNYEIVPIIIDPDNSNGDLLRTVNLMRLYQEIRSSLTFNDNEKNEFFKNPIETLNNDGEFLSPLYGTSGVSFENYLNISTMSLENQAMMRMLFSNDNLSSDMNVGFKGNPNIGTVVLNQFAESKDFSNFATNFVSGDRVFIISSIFGGTGASGFPLLLKNMRTNPNTALSGASIGAVSLLPYFNLKANNKSAIQADSFISKTKSALKYYDRNVTGNNTLDDMYYLGDDFISAGYNNCDGGGGQQNNAHMIELLAALSIIDFASKPLKSGGQARITNFHEFGLQGNPTGSVMFSDFGQKTNNIIRKPLSMMAIIDAYLRNRDVAHRVSQKWAKEYNSILGNNFWQSIEFNYISTFMSDFALWLEEMKDNHLSFVPFRTDRTDDDVLDIVIGHTPQYGSKLFFPKKGCDLIDNKLSSNIDKLPKNLNASQAFMELFYITIKDLCEDKLKI